jgi:hypothetical protein
LAGGALLPCPEKEDLEGITLFFGFYFITSLLMICTGLGSGALEAYLPNISLEIQG